MEKIEFDIVRELKEAGLGLLLIIAGYNLIYWFNWGFWRIFGLLMCEAVLFMTFGKRFSIKNLGITAILILIILYGFKFLGAYGILGYIIGMLLFCGMIIASRYKKWLFAKHYIETTIWGEPLKNFIERGEKPPKLVWGKKDKDET